MGIQEAHAGALAGALSRLSDGQGDAPAVATVPATAIFHPADPAIRLGSTIDLSVSSTGAAANRPLSGAHVRIVAVRDGDAELLLYDLGGSRILPSIDYLPTHGVLDVHFVGLAPADAYARLLSSLRYINRAPHPTPGDRSIEISVLDADGVERPVGHMDLTVATDRPAVTVESLAPGGDAPVATPGAGPGTGTDDAPNPFALVTWNPADGVLDNATILGWHRAGEDPRRPYARQAASVAGELPMDELPMDEPGDAPVFAVGPPHYFGDAAENDAPLLSDGGYRVFSATRTIEAAIAGRTIDPSDGARSGALRPGDLLQTDGPAGTDTIAAPPVPAVPRLDAFLVGLPPSGDPLLPEEGDAAA